MTDWDGLIGGYRQPYDPRPALRAWQEGSSDEAAKELWDNLHHQGDVDTASYACVPELARMIGTSDLPDWNAYALMATIEEARAAEHNPPIPAALETSYRSAWSSIVAPALRHLADAEDDLTVRSIIAVLSHAKGQHSLGAIALLTEDERQEFL